MEFKLSNAQAQIGIDRHRFRVLNCGRRFGKTTLAIEEMKGKLAAQKKRIAYVAPTYQQARDIAWELLKKEFQGASFNEQRLEVRIGNALVALRGWESIETLRGQQFDFIVIDEVAMMRNFWSNWQEVIRPTLTDTKGHALFISTPKGFNHFYDLYNLENTDEDFKSFHFTSYDNPYIPSEELDKAKKELTDDRFAQEYLADFRKTEGLVYKEFDRKKHVFTDDDWKLMGDNMIVEKLAGVDFGFTNPCAIPSLWKDRTDCYWMMEEFYKTGHTDAEVAEYVAAKNFNRVYPDPEAPAAIVELRKRGVNVREVIKGKDSIKNGIDKVRELLKAGKLKIHSSCVNTIMEFEMYSYPDKKDDKNDEENPIDENNHMMDALRYVITMTGKPNTAPVHYAQSAMPRTNMPGQPEFPKKVATTYIPRL